MKINFQRPESTGKMATLEITISPADYNPMLDEQAKKYAKTANIKGFRPGQAPLGLIRRMLGSEAKREAVLETLSKNFKNIESENNFFIVGDPIPTSKDVDFEKQSEFVFGYEMAVVEDFKPNFDMVKIPTYQINVSDEDVNKYINALRKDENEFEDSNAEEATEAKVRLSLTQTENGEEKSYENDETMAFDDFKKEIIEKLKNIAIGESLEGTLDELFANLHKAGDALGLEHEYQHDNTNICKVTLLEWKKAKLAELNEEFFVSIFPNHAEMSTYEHFVGAVTDIIKSEYKRIEEFAKMRFGKKEILKNISVEFPDELYRNQLAKNLESAEDLPDTIENILAKEYPIMKESQIWGFVLRKANEEYNVSVSYEDVFMTAQRQIMQQFGLTQINPDIQKALQDIVQKQLERDNFREYYRIQDEILEARILTKIVASYPNADVETTSFEDLNEKLLNLSKGN